MYRMRYRGYPHSGFAWPWLLFGFLFLVVFGRFLLPLLLVPLLIGLFFFGMKRAHYWHGDWGDWSKRKNDEYDEKPKRHYAQTADGDWVEIV